MSMTPPTSGNRCDFLDVLEEAKLLGRPVSVELAAGDRFEDRVEDVVTEGGEDYAVFVEHARVALSDIAMARRSL